MNKHEPTPKAVQLNIKSAEARRLATELAELTGESLTDAVTAALVGLVAAGKVDDKVMHARSSCRSDDSFWKSITVKS